MTLCSQTTCDNTNCERHYRKGFIDLAPFKDSIFCPLSKEYIKPVHFTIPLKPITKKNNQQILINKSTGKRFIAPSKQYKEYEENALWFLKEMNIDYPVNVKCIFYRNTKGRVDLTNLLEAIDDVLVKAKVLADDNCNIIYSHDGSRVDYDKENPRTEIWIEKIIKEADDENAN